MFRIKCCICNEVQGTRKSCCFRFQYGFLPPLICISYLRKQSHDLLPSDSNPAKSMEQVNVIVFNGKLQVAATAAFRTSFLINSIDLDVDLDFQLSLFLPYCGSQLQEVEETRWLSETPTTANSKSPLTLLLALVEIGIRAVVRDSYKSVSLNRIALTGH